MTLTAVQGVGVGHWTDSVGKTGVTAITFPEPNTAAVEVRGAAPGSRELALLNPGMRVEQIQGIVLTGGSAYGLAAADGVVRALEADGRGHQTSHGVVPIVPAAVIYDFFAGSPDARPGAEEGETAYRSISTAPVEMGSLGAGTGAMVAGWRGSDHMRPGGLGSAASASGLATVGALVVLNAVGDVFNLEGEPLTGGPLRPGPPEFEPPVLENTTLVVMATDARLSRTELMRLNVRAHDAIGACVRPGHTRYDGDIAFAVSCGELESDLDALGEAAFLAVGDAIEAAIPAIEDE